MQVVGWLLLLIPVALFGFIGLRFMIRGNPVRRVRAATRDAEAPAIDTPEFPRTLDLLARIDLTTGHEADILTCGDETYPRLWADLRSAERSITMQMYYASEGEIARTLQQILIDRARAGVKVLFLRDAFGASGLSQEFLDRMSDAGVEVANFRPIKWYSIEMAYTRSHIRVVTIDAKIAYTGGFGLDDKWLGDGRSADQWRDTTVRFTGPAVAELQATFAAGWADATGQLLTGEQFFAPSTHPGEDEERQGRPGDEATPSRPALRAGVLHAAPTIGSTPAERFLALTIAGACKRLWITNAYFVPDLDFVGLLTHACERGADVRVLVPQVTDSKIVYHAGRQPYGQLIEGGVRIWEYQPTMHHAKTIVADDCFAGIGTMNFDNRSLSFNDESMFLAYDAEFTDRLGKIFLADLEFAHEVTLDEWRSRPFWERAASKIAYSGRRVL